MEVSITVRESYTAHILHLPEEAGAPPNGGSGRKPEVQRGWAGPGTAPFCVTLPLHYHWLNKCFLLTKVNEFCGEALAACGQSTASEKRAVAALHCWEFVVHGWRIDNPISPCWPGGLSDGPGPTGMPLEPGPSARSCLWWQTPHRSGCSSAHSSRATNQNQLRSQLPVNAGITLLLMSAPAAVEKHLHLCWGLCSFISTRITATVARVVIVSVPQRHPQVSLKGPKFQKHQHGGPHGSMLISKLVKNMWGIKKELKL